MSHGRWINPTGALRYHARALLQRRRWRPYAASVARWLGAWAPPERAIVLVGPSGGYSLDPAFLARFAAVTCVDPDPLAPRVFRARFGRALGDAGASLAWDARGELLAPGARGFDAAGLASLLAAHRGAAVLFCNLLGQLPLLDPDDRFADSWLAWKRALPEVLRGRSWASYHDRLSGPIEPRIPAGFRASGPLTNEELGAAFYTAAGDAGDAGEGDASEADDERAEEVGEGAEEIEIEDHGTGELFPGHAREYFAWELVRGRWHLIEAVAHREAG